MLCIFYYNKNVLPGSSPAAGETASQRRWGHPGCGGWKVWSCWDNLENRLSLLSKHKSFPALSGSWQMCTKPTVLKHRNPSTTHWQRWGHPALKSEQPFYIEPTQRTRHRKLIDSCIKNQFCLEWKSLSHSWEIDQKIEKWWKINWKRGCYKAVRGCVLNPLAPLAQPTYCCISSTELARLTQKSICQMEARPPHQTSKLDHLIMSLYTVCD